MNLDGTLMIPNQVNARFQDHAPLPRYNFNFIDRPESLSYISAKLLAKIVTELRLDHLRNVHAAEFGLRISA